MEEVKENDELSSDTVAHVLALGREHRKAIEAPDSGWVLPLETEETELPFETAANLLETFGQSGAAKVEVQIWLADAVNGPAIEMRGFINEVQIGENDEGRHVALVSDDWHVALDESRAKFELTCEAMVVANTRDGHEVAIDLGLTD